MFGTDNYYIQDEGRGHETLFVPFGLYNVVRTLVYIISLFFPLEGSPAVCKCCGVYGGTYNRWRTPTGI